ncbi:hypothetical protein AB0M22_03585 [Nocardia sp. NPDC051756]|uniref:hypothetical protein n=1 Tax=Nocardia sp. NPDC051756 TaxID=3154751 RepID=UPI0034154A0E
MNSDDQRPLLAPGDGLAESRGYRPPDVAWSVVMTVPFGAPLRADKPPEPATARVGAA